MIAAMVIAMITITKKSTMLIQIGERTQSQGHAITPPSFSPIKRTVSKPVKPIPLDDDVDIVILIKPNWSVIRNLLP